MNRTTLLDLLETPDLPAAVTHTCGSTFVEHAYRRKVHKATAQQSFLENLPIGEQLAPLDDLLVKFPILVLVFAAVDIGKTLPSPSRFLYGRRMELKVEGP